MGAFLKGWRVELTGATTLPLSKRQVFSELVAANAGILEGDGGSARFKELVAAESCINAVRLKLGLTARVLFWVG